MLLSNTSSCLCAKKIKYTCSLSGPGEKILANNVIGKENKVIEKLCRSISKCLIQNVLLPMSVCLAIITTHLGYVFNSTTVLIL